MLSVVIPTYRRSRTLPGAIASALDQTFSDYEVLVVDNAADPEVEAVVTAAARGARVPVRYVPEPRLGLHYARHAGAHAALGDVLIYIDDDTSFEAEWLTAYARAFDEHPDMAAAGGPLRPIWEVPPPGWLLDYVGHDLTALPLLSLMEPHDTFHLDARGWFYGANMAVRRDVLFDLGGFNPDTFGAEFVGDGETGLNIKLWDRGLLVGYVPDAIAYHHVPQSRMAPAYVRGRFGGQAACDLYTRFRRDGIPSRPALIGEAARVAARSAKYVAAAPLFGRRTDRRALAICVRAAETRARVRYLLRLATSPYLRALVRQRDWLTSPAETPVEVLGG